MTTKYIEIDRAIETALLLLEEGEDEQTLAYNAALVAFIKNMENVPAADVEPRWIPVAEALPTQYGNYFVTMRNNAFGYWQVDIAIFSPKNDKWSSCDADGFYFVGEKGMAVIAWMPLPTPYKGGEKE